MPCDEPTAKLQASTHIHLAGHLLLEALFVCQYSARISQALLKHLDGCFLLRDCGFVLLLHAQREWSFMLLY